MSYMILSKDGLMVIRGLDTKDGYAKMKLRWTSDVDHALRFRFASEAYEWAAEFKDLADARVVRDDSSRLIALQQKKAS